MKKNLLLPWNGETLDIKGYYSPAVPASVDRIDPPQNASFELDSVVYKGVNILNIIPASMQEEIEQKCLTSIQENAGR